MIVVKITGGRTTYAFCFPWDPNERDQNEKNFVYLDETSKNIPIAKISDLVYSNARNFQFGNLVEISKADAVKANKITINPSNAAYSLILFLISTN